MYKRQSKNSSDCSRSPCICRPTWAASAASTGTSGRPVERACATEVLARSTGRPLVPVDAALAAQVGRQMQGERLQSELFFEALRRTL